MLYIPRTTLVTFVKMPIALHVPKLRPIPIATLPMLVERLITLHVHMSTLVVHMKMHIVATLAVMLDRIVIKLPPEILIITPLALWRTQAGPKLPMLLFVMSEKVLVPLPQETGITTLMAS
jgi:hypothetical protein